MLFLSSQKFKILIFQNEEYNNKYTDKMLLSTSHSIFQLYAESLVAIIVFCKALNN